MHQLVMNDVLLTSPGYLKIPAVPKVYSFKFMKRIIALLTLLASFNASIHAAAILTLNPADHICLIGNALADRMQHHGWLETLIVAKFPRHDLVFRNLAVSGDEVAF